MKTLLLSKSFSLVTLLVLGSSLSGCSSLSLGKLKTALAGEENRAEMLSKSVESYHRAVYWGDSRKASMFVEPEVKSSFVQDLASRKTSEKLVEISVQSIDLSPDTKEATVLTKTRYYKIPSYRVEERFETESWRYEKYNGGWMNTGVEETIAAADSIEEDGKPAKPFRARLGAFKEGELEF